MISLVIYVVLLLLLAVANCQTPVYMPNTYYPGKSTSAQVGDILCFQINACTGGMGGYSDVQLVIDLSSNPTWDLQQGYVIAEISQCKDSFNKTCVLYTSYEWNDGLNITAFSNVTFPWPSTNGDLPLYLRFIGVQAPASFTFQLTYGQYGYSTYGQYDFDAFGTSDSCQFSPVHQYARASNIVTVNNAGTVFYQLQFCPNNDFPSDSWTASINLITTIEKPKSAFEIWACAASTGLSNCKTTHNDGSNLAATAVVNLNIQNSQNVPINKGIIIGIYGVGGEYDYINQGILSVSVANS